MAGFCAGDGADDGAGVGFGDDRLDVGGGELEAVEEDCGAPRIDAVAGEGGDEQGDGDLDGLGIFGRREIELDGIRGGNWGESGMVLGGFGGECAGIGLGSGEC